MSILTPDYERLQSSATTDNELVHRYRRLFGEQNISGAQALITPEHAHLVMSADKLNDLVDTINYMQQFWMDDKDQFVEWYMNMTKSLDLYSTSKTYNVGNLVTYNSLPYFCLEHDVTGVWDSSKWILLKPVDTGLTIYGEDTGSLLLDNSLLWEVESNNLINWKYMDNSGSQVTQVATTHPNIRYIDSGVPGVIYDDEIYMTEWDGGGA